MVIIPTTLKFLRYIMMWDYLRALTSNVINAKFLTFSTSDTKIKKKNVTFIRATMQF